MELINATIKLDAKGYKNPTNAEEQNKELHTQSTLSHTRFGIEAYIYGVTEAVLEDYKEVEVTTIIDGKETKHKYV